MKQHSPGFIAIVNDAKSRIRETDIHAVRKMIQEGRKFTLVDVREESEWAAGHLPGALHLSKGVIERDVEKVIPDPDAPLVLYCGGGYRSALASDHLQQMGYKNVLSMDGGFTAWRDAGFAVEG